MSDKTTVRLVGFSITGDGASYNIHGNLESITLTAAQAQRAGERMIALEQRIADLEAQLAKSQRREELLRAVAEAARDHLVAIEGEFVNAVPVDTIEFRNKLRGSLWTAIDGGALEGE